MMTELLHQKNCKKNTLITDYHTGEIACSNCGAVSFEKIVDAGQESSGLTGEEYNKTSKAGGKISLKMIDMGLSTIIEAHDKDSKGNSLSIENRRIFYRLRMWDRNSRSAVSLKSFQKAFTLLDGISSKLGLPDVVIEQTAHLFRKIAAKKILAGRSTAGMLCAAVYITCRTTDTPRTLQDIADAGNVRKKTLQRVYRYLVRDLDIYPEIFNPSEFVSRISKAVGISEKSERSAYRILEIAAKNNISTSKNPMAMAATAIHLAATINNEKISQTKISKVSGISAVTIRERVKEIKKIGGEIYGQNM
ncbi:MAG: transcription factor TFIIB [Nitrosopumilus sp.]|uniref:transcription initiation factor IIB n=1 Tax=Nitrosopumilus sp. TaxID=2024843 RepID=UPI00247E292F|nr:transcription factor TFIIB [Nitrosopumilus sp.]MCV0392412.1 transcription factor TFIIB [Nitrosopumilus sp.]